jgi:hypothetical protein
MKGIKLGFTMISFPTLLPQSIDPIVVGLCAISAANKHPLYTTLQKYQDLERVL